MIKPTGPTRQFDSKVFYDPASQVSSLIHTALAGSSVAESAHHYVYDDAGNIGSKQVEKPGLAATMIARTSGWFQHGGSILMAFHRPTPLKYSENGWVSITRNRDPSFHGRDLP